MARIGLVSDTHGYFDDQLEDVLAGVDLILHAGDVGSVAILDRLELIAPTITVRGNVDTPPMGLPLSLAMTIDGIGLEMVHILPASQEKLRQWGGSPLTDVAIQAARRFWTSFRPETQIVVFGHTHQPYLDMLGPLLLINPGSAGKKRFNLPRCCGVLETRRRRMEVKIVSLEGYNEIKQATFRAGKGGLARCSP